MKLRYIVVLLTIGSIFLSPTAIAELSEAAKLRLQCEKEREEQLAPLREKEIEACVAKQSSREECEAKFSDFGSASRTVTGGSRLRMFDELPTCVAARDAELAEEQAMREERKKGEGARDTVPGATRESTTATTTRDSSAGTTKRETAPGATRESSTGTSTRESSTGTTKR